MLCYNLNKENEHLQKVEWLYRYERVSYDAEGIRNMMLREEAMMVGNRQEQDSIKAMTIRLERRKNADLADLNAMHNLWWLYAMPRCCLTLPRLPVAQVMLRRRLMLC